MPNYVTNKIYLNCKNEDTLEKIVEFVKSDNSDFDFNNIVPMPETLNITSGGYMTEYVLAYLNSLDSSARRDIIEKLKSTPADFYGSCYKQIFAYHSEYEPVSADRLKQMESSYAKEYANIKPTCVEDVGKTYVENVLNYGCFTWYEWACDNWGTKWNAIDAEVSTSEIYFQTAWSRVLEIVQKLSVLFPTVEMTYEYADEDFGSNLGRMIIKNGLITDSYMPDNGSEEAYALAEEILGYSLEDEEEDEEE